MPRTHPAGTGRILTGAVALTLSLGLAACQTGSSGPEVGADVEDLQQEVGELESGTAEDDVAAGDEQGLGEEEEQYVGEEVTISGDVTAPISASAFVMSGAEDGTSVFIEAFSQGVLIISTSGPVEVTSGEVARATGTVYEVDSGVFQKVGYTPDQEFFDAFGVADEEEFLNRFQAQPVLAAESVEVLEPAG